MIEIKLLENQEHCFDKIQITFSDGSQKTVDKDDFYALKRALITVDSRESVMDMLNEQVDATKDGDFEDGPLDAPITEDMLNNPAFIKAMTTAYENGDDLAADLDSFANDRHDSITECMNDELSNWSDPDREI